MKVRFTDFTTITRDKSLSQPTSDARQIYNSAWECFDRVPRNLSARKIRLLGVRLSNFEAANPPDRAPGTVVMEAAAEQLALHLPDS